MAQEPKLLQPNRPQCELDKDMSAYWGLHHYVNAEGERMTFDGICAELLGDLHNRLAAEHVRALQGLRVANARLAAENINLGRDRLLEANKVWHPQHSMETSHPHPAEEEMGKSESRPFFANRPVSDRPDYASAEVRSPDLLVEVQEEETFAKGIEVLNHTSPALQEHAGEIHTTVGTAGQPVKFNDLGAVQVPDIKGDMKQTPSFGRTSSDVAVHAEDSQTRFQDSQRRSSVCSIVKEAESRFKTQVLKASEDMFMDDVSSDEQTNGTRESAWLALPSKIVSHAWFEVWVAILIITNTIFLGFEVDDYMRNQRESTILEVIGMTYNCLFIIEWGLRIMAYGWKFVRGPQWSWHLLDTLIVLGTILEIVTEALKKQQREGDPVVDSRMTSLKLMRIVRTMRMLRILRIARLLKVVRPFRLLIWQIIGTLRSVCWALLLFLIIDYIFALFFAQAVAHSQDAMKAAEIQKYWSSLSGIMSTLFMSVTGGVDWENAISALDHLGDLKRIYRFLFMAYISFVLFAVLNTVTGVFCQKAIESAKHDHETMIRDQLLEKRMYMKKTRELFCEIDHDASDTISYKEFSKRMADEQVIAYFAIMGLDVSDAWDLFKLLDTDRNAEIDLNEFVEGCVKLRGTAKAIDVAKLSYDNKLMRARLATFMRDTEDMLDHIFQINTGASFSRYSSTTAHVARSTDTTRSHYDKPSLASHL